MLKRAFDLVSSGVALLLLMPLLGLLLLWIRLDSPGPALFRQVRLGRDQRPFRVLKFRTMLRRDADAIDQVAESVVVDGTDPRITRAGRFLRWSSLDELPQLWNILVGDMSVVGPRPVLPEQRQAIPEAYVERFKVRPGLTGLAQVRGRRGLDWMDQLAADAEYVRRQGFFYDVALIFRTIRVVVAGSGVYGHAGKNWRAFLKERERE
jgi:lipopolysaccharide/colanic/teichoic acid biosynthesis glycosyltransferase